MWVQMVSGKKRIRHESWNFRLHNINWSHLSHFDLKENQDELVWYVGKIALVSDKNGEILDPDPSLAYKVYLHKPSMQNGKFTKLEDWVKKFPAHGVLISWYKHIVCKTVNIYFELRYNIICNSKCIVNISSDTIW